MPSREWRNLNPASLGIMQQRLGREFDEFATFCEATGLLRNNFMEIDRLVSSSFRVYDAAYVCSMCAAALVSAANHFGGQGDTVTARRLASWALLIEPICIPGMLCLATCATVEGRDDEVADWRRRIQETYRMLGAKPPQQLTAYESGLLEAGEPELG